MDDKCIMENILLTTKGVCDLYLHGAIESPTPNAHRQQARSNSFRRGKYPGGFLFSFARLLNRKLVNYLIKFTC